MSSLPLSSVHVHVPSSPSGHGHAHSTANAVTSPSQVGVAGLDAVEILEFRSWLKEKQARAEEEKKQRAEAAERAQSWRHKLVALYEEHKILSLAIQFVVTVGVAFVLGYYSLKGQVDDAKQQATELTSQLRTQQSEVNAVQLNVGALQGPVASLVTQVSALNVAALQANISAANIEQAALQRQQDALQVGAGQLQGNFTALNTQLSSSQQLADLYQLNSTVHFLQSSNSASAVKWGVFTVSNPAAGAPVSDLSLTFNAVNQQVYTVTFGGHFRSSNAAAGGVYTELRGGSGLSYVTPVNPDRPTYAPYYLYTPLDTWTLFSVTYLLRATDTMSVTVTPYAYASGAVDCVFMDSYVVAHKIGF